MSTAAVAVHAAIAEAAKASGAIVRIQPGEFRTLLQKASEPLVVVREGGVFSTKYEYLMGYKGLVFFTSSKEQLGLPSGASVVKATKIWIPGSAVHRPAHTASGTGRGGMASRARTNRGTQHPRPPIRTTGDALCPTRSASCQRRAYRHLPPLLGGSIMLPLNRRDFLRAGGLGLAGTMMNGLWSDLLAKGIAPPPTVTFFEERFGITRELMTKTLEAAGSKGADFAELFFEYKIVNSVRMEEDILKDSSEGITLGVGIRVIKGAQTGYGYTDDLSPERMRQTALSAAAIAAGNAKLSVADLTVKTSPFMLYDRRQPLEDVALDRKVDVVRKAYAAAQSYDRRVTKVQVTMVDEIQYVTVVNSEGLLISDVRPQAIMIVSSTAEEKGVKNTGFKTAGGRVGLGYYSSIETPESIGRKASEDAILLLSAIDPPAGEQPVVLGSRQSGVMIHEAVGHPLEADGNRKKTSIMWDKLGKQVANPIVTIFDDPTIPHSRGSLNVDDEGIVPLKTPLIDKGTLVGFLQDRLSAKLMGMSPNGHGRRMSFRYAPIPRMANTVLAPGDAKAEEIIRSVKKGFFAETYQGGQVSDSGKFTFSVNMGYLIEDGKLTRPVKNATLIGTNVQILNEVEMIGNDTRFFLGSCGKDGQSAP